MLIMEFGKYIAHRGLHKKGVPENSMAAFSAAVDKKIAVELDVRLTKDGKIVVFHNKNLLRMCSVEADVCDFTYEQLSQFTLNETNQKIPLLAEVLKLVNGKVPLLIEIKSGALLGELEKRLIHLMKKYNGDYAVQSFNPFSLLYFRIFSPKTVRAQLVSEYKNKFDFEYIMRKICAQPIVWKIISKPEIIAADLRSISLETAFKAVDANADLFTWTAHGKELIETAGQFSKTIIAEDFPKDFDFNREK